MQIHMHVFAYVFHQHAFIFYTCILICFSQTENISKAAENCLMTVSMLSDGTCCSFQLVLVRILPERWLSWAWDCIVF